MWFNLLIIKIHFETVVVCSSYIGFYFIPEALSVEEQCRWIRESLTSFPQPPNRTNHNAIYGSISDLFDAAKERRVLVEEKSSCTDLDDMPVSSISNADGHRWKFVEEPVATSRGNTCKSVPASLLVRKLRWSTLGLQFDWSKVIALSFPAIFHIWSQTDYYSLYLFYSFFLYACLSRVIYFPTLWKQPHLEL